MKLSLAPLRALAAGALLSLAACGGTAESGTTLKVADQLHALKSSLDVAGEGQPTDYKIESVSYTHLTLPTTERV